MVIANTKQKKGRPHIRMVKAEIRGKSLLTWFYPMTLYSAALRALAGKCSEKIFFSGSSGQPRQSHGLQPVPYGRNMWKIQYRNKRKYAQLFLVELILET